MKIFVCEDQFEWILCGIYDAWDSGLGHGNVRVETRRNTTMELFADYEEVSFDQEKAEKVIRSVKRKLPEEVFWNLYRAGASCAPDKGDCMYRYLVQAFRAGDRILSMYQDPAVMRMFEICRQVGNETHLMLEFLRFRQLRSGALYAVIEPKSDQAALVAPHFADRFPEENWIIYDRNHGKAAVHPAGRDWFLAEMKPEWGEELDRLAGEDGYEDLWQVFFETIAIEERKNEACQRNHLPLRYRNVMTEFIRLQKKKEETVHEADVCVGHTRFGKLLPDDEGAV